MIYPLLTARLQEIGLERCSIMQMGRYKPIWLAFRPGQEHPAAVVKFTRDPSDSSSAAVEFAALRRLAPYAGDLGIPNALFEGLTADGGRIFVQSGMPGRGLPLLALNLSANSRAVIDWLERFQSLAPATGSLCETALSYVDACRENLVGLTEAEAALLDHALRLAPELAAFPATAVHGDFWSGNVILNKGKVQVIDWDGFRSGSPTEDLHNYLSEDFELPTDSCVESYWDVQFGGGSFSRQHKDAALRLMASHGIPADRLTDLYALHLLSRLHKKQFTTQRFWRMVAARFVRQGMPRLFD